MAEDLYHTIAEIIIEFKTLLHALFHCSPTILSERWADSLTNEEIEVYIH